MDNKQEVPKFHFGLLDSQLIIPLQMIDIIETVYRGAAKGRGLVVSPKGCSSIFTRGTWTDLGLRLLHSL